MNSCGGYEVSSTRAILAPGRGTNSKSRKEAVANHQAAVGETNIQGSADQQRRQAWRGRSSGAQARQRTSSMSVPEQLPLADGTDQHLLGGCAYLAAGISDDPQTVKFRLRRRRPPTVARTPAAVIPGRGVTLLQPPAALLNRDDGPGSSRAWFAANSCCYQPDSRRISRTRRVRGCLRFYPGPGSARRCRFSRANSQLISRSRTALA